MPPPLSGEEAVMESFRLAAAMITVLGTDHTERALADWRTVAFDTLNEHGSSGTMMFCLMWAFSSSARLMGGTAAENGDPQEALRRAIVRIERYRL